MPVQGVLERPVGHARPKVFQASVVGPTSYSAGGFTVSTGLSSISIATVTPRDGTVGAGADTVRAVRYSWSGGTITIQVFQASTVGTGPNAWAEVPNATNLSGVTFDIIAFGE